MNLKTAYFLIVSFVAIVNVNSWNDCDERLQQESVWNHQLNYIINSLDRLEANALEVDTILDKINQTEKNVLSKLEAIEEKLYELELCKSEEVQEDCKDHQNNQNASGVYKIRPKTSPISFAVWCDMDTEGGGWTYVLNRFDGSQNFFLNWTDYKYGFGNLVEEFWLGLENIYRLTSSRRYQLLIELTDWDNTTVQAYYNDFEIGNELEGYALKSLGEYSGTAGDSFKYQLGMKFSTRDRDHDDASWNCAQSYKGGWWYNACHANQLTGLYLSDYELEGREDNNQATGIHWESFKRLNYSLKAAKMMIRPL